MKKALGMILTLALVFVCCAAYATGNQNGLRHYSTSEHISNYTVNADLDEMAAGIFNIEIAIAFDANYTTNDDIVLFNLYINDTFVSDVTPYWWEGNDIAAATTFFNAIGYKDAINNVYVRPVRGKAGESINETAYLYGQSSGDAAYTPTPTPPQEQPSAYDHYAASMQMSNYAINAHLDEMAEGIFNIEISIEFDEGYTTNDDIVKFNLYINGAYISDVTPYWWEGNEINAATTFFNAIGYKEAISFVYVKPVREEAGESADEIVILFKQNADAQLPNPDLTTGHKHLSASTHLVDYTVNATFDEVAENAFNTHIAITFDMGYTSNDDIVSFNLYINGSCVANIPAYWGEGNEIIAATTFFASVSYQSPINSVYVKPVRGKAGECDEIVLLTE